MLYCSCASACNFPAVQTYAIWYDSGFLLIGAGKVNVVVQTERTIPPNAVMKRRKKKDAYGNIIPSEPGQDHREECGGVGSDAVATPNVVM